VPLLETQDVSGDQRNILKDLFGKVLNFSRLAVGFRILDGLSSIPQFRKCDHDLVRGSRLDPLGSVVSLSVSHQIAIFVLVA